jgi:hypothetical protein
MLAITAACTTRVAGARTGFNGKAWKSNVKQLLLRQKPAVQYTVDEIGA